jgi:hypothetical protein
MPPIVGRVRSLGPTPTGKSQGLDSAPEGPAPETFQSTCFSQLAGIH